jgi:hypothetical protein
MVIQKVAGEEKYNDTLPDLTKGSERLIQPHFSDMGNRQKHDKVNLWSCSHLDEPGDDCTRHYFLSPTGSRFRQLEYDHWRHYYYALNLHFGGPCQVFDQSVTSWSYKSLIVDS